MRAYNPADETDQAAQVISSWKIISRDAVGKRAVAQCMACGKGRELAISALTAGEPIACPGCAPVSFYGPAPRRSFSADVADLETHGARRRHRGSP